MDWFEAARERFGGAGEFPLIDDEEIVEREAVYEHWPWFSGSERDTDELRQAALRVDHLDPSARFVYLNLFYRLAHYPAEKLAVVAQDRDTAGEQRKQFEHDLEVLVRLVDVEQCTDARRIRWEIVNACAVRDWDRAKRLYVRLDELAQGQIAQVLAMRGRFEFLVVFRERWGFEEFGLCSWAPMPDEPLCQLLQMMLCGGSVSVKNDPLAALSADEVGRLDDAAHHLAKALRDRPDLDIVYSFLLLRCRLALGRFREAAADCEALLRRRGEFIEQTGQTHGWLVSRLYELAVNAYESDGQIERAIGASDRWIREFPDEPGICECRSHLFQMQGDFKAAYEELKKEVDRNPVRGKDPAVEMALAFGRLYQDLEAQWGNFKKRVDIREEDLVRAVVRVHWPQIEELADWNIKDWVDSCYLMLRREPDNPLMMMNAVTRLVENELRTRVFERFRKDFQCDKISSTSERSEDPLGKYLCGDDRITLGQMLNEIRFPEARTGAGRRFRQWLSGENLLPGLLRVDLHRLYKLHIPGKHIKENYTPSWADAEQLARLSHGLLSAILEG